MDVGGKNLSSQAGRFTLNSSVIDRGTVVTLVLTVKEDILSSQQMVIIHDGFVLPNQAAVSGQLAFAVGSHPVVATVTRVLPVHQVVEANAYVTDGVALFGTELPEPWHGDRRVRDTMKGGTSNKRLN